MTVLDGGESPEGAHHAGQVVGNGGRAGRDGRAIGVARDVAGSAHRRGDAPEAGALPVRSRLPEGGDAHHDETAVHRAQILPAEVPALERAGPEVLGDDVGGGGEALDEGLALGGAQVAGDGLLVARLDQPEVGEPVGGGAAEAAEIVATPGCSTLITSAPNSPSSVQQKGAATKVARSSAVRPSSGRAMRRHCSAPTRRSVGPSLTASRRSSIIGRPRRLESWRHVLRRAR